MSRDKMARMLDKIAKLLAKAESSTFPAEAEAFTEHAERLMVRYGIAKAEVDAERGRQGQTQEPIVEERVQLLGEYSRVQLEGLQWVLGAYRLVTTMQAKFDTGAVLYVVGAESDVKQMVQLAESLRIQQQAALKSYWAGATNKAWMTDAERRRERRTFALNFYRGAAVRLQQIVGQEAESTGTELVLVDRRKRADEWVGQQYPNIKAARQTRLDEGTAAARAAGVAAGFKADVNGKKLDGAVRGALAGVS